MINGAESSKQIGSSSNTIKLRQEQGRSMNSQKNEFSTGEVTHQSVNDQIKLATEPILRQFETFCAMLANQKELETTGNSEATASGRENSSASSSENRCDTMV